MVVTFGASGNTISFASSFPHKGSLVLVLVILPHVAHKGFEG
jgi:hypothetical protein